MTKKREMALTETQMKNLKKEIKKEKERQRYEQIILLMKTKKIQRPTLQSIWQSNTEG